MRRKLVLVFIFGLAMFVGVTAEATIVSWDANDGLLPEDSTPPWELIISGACSSSLVTEGDDAPYLNINTMDVSSGTLTYRITDPVLDTHSDLTFSIYARLETYNTTDMGFAASVRSQDGTSTYTYYSDVYLFSDKVGLAMLPGTTYYSLDTTQWHEYTMRWDYTNKQVSLYVDGELAIEPGAMKSYDPGTALGSRFYFGDNSNGDNRRCDADVKYAKVSTLVQFPGDAGGDGVVDEVDAAILAEHWLAGGATWFMGDFNDDQIVDDKDATIMATNWHHGMSEAVPEPSMLVLLCTVFSVLFLSQCRDKGGERRIAQ